MRLIMNEGQRHEIYGKIISAGEEFDVPEDEARVWKMMGRARDAPEPVVKRRYNRRDMRAEDE